MLQHCRLSHLSPRSILLFFMFACCLVVHLFVVTVLVHSFSVFILTKFSECNEENERAENKRNNKEEKYTQIVRWPVPVFVMSWAKWATVWICLECVQCPHMWAIQTNWWHIHREPRTCTVQTSERSAHGNTHTMAATRGQWMSYFEWTRGKKNEQNAKIAISKMGAMREIYIARIPSIITHIVKVKAIN